MSIKYANSHEQCDEIPAELPESPHPVVEKYLDNLITQQKVARDALLWARFRGNTAILEDCFLFTTSAANRKLMKVSTTRKACLRAKNLA